LIRLVF